jgi:hypothetical protein
LEDADFPKATREKQRLEEKQRSQRKLRETQGKEWVANYFKEIIDDIT